MCSAAVFVVMLDGTVVNVGLPSIGRSFDTGTTGLQWVVDGYLLVLACGLLGAGAAGDRFGRRKVFQIGLVTLGLASMAASLAPNLPALVGFRMVQGLGAAMLPPSGLSIIANTFPERNERAAAMGTWGAISGLAVASGPLLGGILVTALGWRSIFWANVPVIVLAALLARRHVDESAATRPPRLDLAGQILSATSLAALAAGLILAPQRGWTSPAILGLLGLAAAALTGFLAVEHHRTDPMLALRFFANRAFSASAAIATLMYLALNGFTFLTTLYLQNVRGDSPFIAGLSLLPSTALITLAALVSARLTRAYGPRRPILAATAMVSAGLLLLTLARDRQGFALLAVAYLGVGAGMGLMNPPVTMTAMAALPADQSGVAAGVTGTARQVGSVLGVALVGSVATGGPHRAAGMTDAARAHLVHGSHLGYAIGAGASATAGLIALVALTPTRAARRRTNHPAHGSVKQGGDDADNTRTPDHLPDS